MGRQAVISYYVIVIGHLKWNPYFGETQSLPPRGDPSTCTSTLICGKDKRGMPFRLLVDPTLRLTPEAYYYDLNRRTGLHPEDITHCFCTHEHYDHQAGLNYFPDAAWMAGEKTAKKLMDSPYIDGRRVCTVKGEFLPGVSVVELPGHTESLCGVDFICSGRRVIVAGDGVMTQNHFWDCTTMFETDAQEAAETIRMMQDKYDIVIPGHDNMIINSRR